MQKLSKWLKLIICMSFIFVTLSYTESVKAASFYYDKYTLSPGYTVTAGPYTNHFYGSTGYNSIMYQPGSSPDYLIIIWDTTLSDGYTAYDVDYSGNLQVINYESGRSIYSSWRTFSKINDTQMQYKGHDDYRCAPEGCYGARYYEAIFTVSKKGNLVESNVIKDESYPATEGAKDGFWWVRKGPANRVPTLNITTTNHQILASQVGLNKYKVQGSIRDIDNDTVTITAEIAGVAHSTTIANTLLEKTFELNFDVISDQIPNGVHQVKITANDGYGGIVTQTLSVTVKTRASNNLYIVLDDIVYYETIYSDLELDIQSAERWKFVHNQNYFEHPIGLIPDHNVWRSNTYTQFSKTGHFNITYQGMDTLSLIPEYQKWSRDSFDTLNLYVHRKPVPQFTIAVHRNNSGGFPTDIDDTSYDLDKQSLFNGIAESEWNWKDSTATAWTSGKPPVNLTINRSYDVKLRVKDHQGLWSVPLIKTFSTTGAPILTNNPPVATMTVPSGTQANPTVFATQKPTFSWTQTDPDASTVFKSFEIQVTNEANTTTVLNSGTISQNTSNTTKSWVATSNLPAGQKLRVRVRVSDGLLWSNWSAQTWMFINRPPVASFDWSPKPVWEGDTVMITNQSTDADGDALSYSWSIIGPGNYQYTSTNYHVSRNFIRPGDYSVTLTVSDGKAQSNVTRIIRVETLGLTANVSYTDLWLEHHLLMGHETIQNPKSFYSGEIFIVSAVGSLAATNSVTASLDAIGRDGNPISIAVDLDVTNPVNHFQGSLYDPILSSLTGGLPEGPYQIKFKIAYTNGISKEVNIPIQIIGHVQGAVNVHRRQ